MSYDSSSRSGYRSADLGEDEPIWTEDGKVLNAVPVVERRKVVRLRRAPDGRWNADEVAEHLMSCEREIVLGLAWKRPWAGLDEETQASCYGHAVAIVARIAESSQRPEWRRAGDLEKAQVAAYRNQALEHWRRVNTQSRRGERFVLLFDPERHAAGHSPIDALFASPDLHAVESDLLAELVQEQLRDFWTIVLREQVGFKDAGDRLGLTKAGVIAHTRAGRAAFAEYLERRATGDLCIQRGADIAADRRGAASPVQSRRARAHLESCYACALAYEPRTSAFQRGILSISPLGLALRLATRASEAASAPATRIAETSAASRAVAAGAVTLALAGSGVGIQAATRSQARDATGPSAKAGRIRGAESVSSGVHAAPPFLAPQPLGREQGRSTLIGRAIVRRSRSTPKHRRATPRTRPVAPVVASSPPPTEFDIERTTASQAAVAPPAATTASASSPSPSPALDAGATEFPTP